MQIISRRDYVTHLHFPTNRILRISLTQSLIWYRAKYVTLYVDERSQKAGFY